jgi:hypothetical protein
MQVALRLDAASREWNSAVVGYNASVAAVCGYREKFVSRCSAMLGDAPHVTLPVDSPAPYSDAIRREQ